MFNVAHVLASCPAFDRTALQGFLEAPSNKSDTRKALAILKRLAKTSWEPLDRFYRQNYHTFEIVGIPEVDTDDSEVSGSEPDNHQNG